MADRKLSNTIGNSNTINFSYDSGTETYQSELNHLGLENLSDPNADNIPFWDDSAGAMAWLTPGTGININTTSLDVELNASQLLTQPIQNLVYAISAEDFSASTGTAKLTTRSPYAFTLTEVRAHCAVAPTGQDAIIDINVNGSSILSTRLHIDAGEKTSVTSATSVALSSTSLADDDEITFDLDQVGSTEEGQGYKVVLIGRKT